MSDANAALKVHSKILLAIAAVALLICGYELHRYWTDKMPSDIESLATLALALLTIVLAYFNWKLSRDTSAALDLARKEFEVSQAQFTLSQQQFTQSQEQSALSEKQFELTQEQAAIARKQYETEWRPDLRIASVMPRTNDAEFRLANLGRSAALVKTIKIGTGSGPGEPRNVAEYPLPCLVKAGEIWPEGLVTEKLRLYFIEHLTQESSGGNWQAAMNLALVYDCGGRTDNVSPWFGCTLTVWYSRTPSGPSIQRIQVVSG